MAVTNIGLEDKELLKWFNQMHAALKQAESGYVEASEIDEKERATDPDGRPEGTLVNPRRAPTKGKTIGTIGAVAKYKKVNTKLIAVLKAVIKEVENASALDYKASRWMGKK